MEFFTEVVGTSIKIYALMTPPAVLSAFISGTKGFDKKHKSAVAAKTSTAIFLIGVTLFLFGPHLFSLFGFTLDAFRIGAGVLLFLTAVSLMLAQRLPTILPPLDFEESLEVTKIYSVSGKLPPEGGLMRVRPFRAPHHTISDVALVGGGGFPRPGEVSLAHRGVLFLDELPEFRKTALEALRQPLEGGVAAIARAAHSVVFPAACMDITLVSEAGGMCWSAFCSKSTASRSRS